MHGGFAWYVDALFSMLSHPILTVTIIAAAVAGLVLAVRRRRRRRPR